LKLHNQVQNFRLQKYNKKPDLKTKKMFIFIKDNLFIYYKHYFNKINSIVFPLEV